MTCVRQSALYQVLRMLSQRFHGMTRTFIRLQISKTPALPTIFLENGTRQERPPDRFVKSGRAQFSDQGMPGGNIGKTGQFHFPVRNQHIRQQSHQGERRRPEVGLRFRQTLHRAILEITLPGVDQIIEWRTGEPIICDTGCQRPDHFMLARCPGVNPLDTIAPPLQPDRTDHGFTHAFTGLRHLVIEGVQRENRLAVSYWRKEGEPETVRIMPPPV